MRLLERLNQPTVRPWLRFSLAVFLGACLGLHAGQVEPPVTADYAPLQKTLMLSLGDGIFKSSELGPSSFPLFLMGLPRGALTEHAQLWELLQKNGVEILDVFNLTDEAVAEARKQGKLADWLRRTFPVTAQEMVAALDEIDAATLFYRRDDHFYRVNKDQDFDPLSPGIASMYWARDFAISTPRGIVIGHGQRYGRSLENAIARLIFNYAPSLRDFQIVFDAEKEDVHLDGGDVIVLDEDTLLVGVGNRSSREAAPLLARKLKMEVLAVSMPPVEEPSGLRRQLLHLDTIFNIVDRDKVLALPYFLEKEFSEKNPMVPVLLGLAKQMEALNQDVAGGVGDPEFLRKAVRQIPDIGWVTRFAPETGEATELNLKLVDYFRDLGFTVIPVGGPQGRLSVEKYALERVMYELRWQAGNVVQLEPGRLIGFRHNRHTNDALRKAGVEVLTFDGELLSIRGGGPHCLLMPLVRR